ncbi:MAG: hydroxyisourate hydrolase [Rhodobacteraceae bacterium]|nr:hydroxyisourate hydrolase [Paracoccaceae bacterium]
MGKLTTHVLDTALGKPAVGIKIELFHISGTEHKKIGSYVTNADGRIDTPLLQGASFKTGTYELVFFAGDYLDQTAQALPEPKFLDQIPLRFGISEDSHYHVPLLLSPYSYSTYRGS